MFIKNAYINNRAMLIFAGRMQASSSTDYKSLYEVSQLRVITLEQHLAQLQKIIFGSKQERFTGSEQNPSQLSLAIQFEAVAACSVVDAKKVSYVKQQRLPTRSP